MRRRRTRPRRSRITGNLRTIDYSRPMPPRLNAKLRYTAGFKTITTGIWASGLTWSLNDLYDPDVSGVGHQPMGYDQMCNFYNNWRVTGVKYSITFHSTSADGMKCIVFPRRQGATYGSVTIETLQEQAFARKMKVIATDTPTSNGVFKGYLPLSSVFGVTREKYRVDDVYEGSVGSSPASTAVIDCMAQFKDNSSSQTVYVSVDLLYYVTFFNPRYMPQS